MRVVLDTNVLISGLLSSSRPPGQLVGLWIEGRITVLVSPELAQEYQKVLSRPEFERLGTQEERMAFLQDLLDLSNVVWVEPSERLKVVKEDPSDNVVLECALAGEAQVVITGDQHLLALQTFRGTRILSPREALDLLGL